MVGFLDLFFLLDLKFVSKDGEVLRFNNVATYVLKAIGNLFFFVPMLKLECLN